MQGDAGLSRYCIICCMYGGAAMRMHPCALWCARVGPKTKTSWPISGTLLLLAVRRHVTRLDRPWS